MTTATQVRERPILFSGSMVKAILAGRKTQTRRIVSRISGFGSVRQFHVSTTPGYDWQFRCRRGLWQDVRMSQLLNWCPYGQVGDCLWVRESFAIQSFLGIPLRERQPIEYLSEVDDPRQIEDYVGKPSIHMPKWASRIFLEVTGVRVERLWDISESDAIAEGVELCHCFQMAKSGHPLAPHKTAFAWLWNEINGRESWQANPWVWVVEFKRDERGI